MLGLDLEVALRRFALAERLLIGLDFDGVLAPIVNDPQASRPLPAAMAALAVLAADPQVTCALISGRTLADLRRLADPPEQAVLVGGHGAQLAWPGGDDVLVLDDGAQDRLVRLSVALHAIAADHPGTAVEEKPTGVVLHTRQADPEIGQAASAAAWAGPARWPGVYPILGKEVVDISVLEVSKGIALQMIRAKVGPAPDDGGVLYVGDDVTDEAAFAVLDDSRGDVTIKVGAGQTLARHRLLTPEDVADRLTLLVHLRRFA